MIFIKGNVPSLKNSKVKTSRGVFMSKTCRHYLQSLGIKNFGKAGVEDYKTRINIFRASVGNYFDGVQYPCLLGVHFVRDSKRKFDFINGCQIVFDLLVAHGYLIDDDMDHIIPTPMMISDSWYTIKKDNPGVLLKIL